MNAVGIDVSKNKSMVAVARPLGQVVVKPFEVRHTAIELKKLADFLKSLDGETRVVMEHTGRYYEPVAPVHPCVRRVRQRGQPAADQGVWEQFAAP